MSELDEWIEDILRSNPRPSFIDDGASECIARTLRNLSAMGGHSLNTLKAVGDVILADLYARGYAVVKLPKPLGVNGEDDAVWLKAPYIAQDFRGDVVISDRLGLDSGELLDVAAALLAAHRACEDSW